MGACTAIANKDVYCPESQKKYVEPDFRQQIKQEVQNSERLSMKKCSFVSGRKMRDNSQDENKDALAPEFSNTNNLDARNNSNFQWDKSSSSLQESISKESSFQRAKRQKNIVNPGKKSKGNSISRNLSSLKENSDKLRNSYQNKSPSKSRKHEATSNTILLHKCKTDKISRSISRGADKIYRPQSRGTSKINKIRRNLGESKNSEGQMQKYRNKLKEMNREQNQQLLEDSEGSDSMFRETTFTSKAASQYSTLKDQTCLNRHAIPSQSLPNGLINEALVRSSLSFSVPTVIKTQVRFEDESFYHGEWMNGAKHGLGRLEWKEGTYEGEWKQDKFNGKGTVTFNDGQSYSGNWLQNQAHGDGIYKYKDGSVYKGQWKENRQDGYGIHEWSPNEYYTGTWLNGCKDGQGQLIFEDGSYYKGSFFGNQLHGQGQYYWHQRLHYKGSWQHNKKSGFGVLKLSTGDLYEGEFHHDKMHGNGKLTTKDGTVYEGNWQNGKREGKVKETRTGGQIKNGFWYYGKLLHDEDELRQLREQKKKQQIVSFTTSQ